MVKEIHMDTKRDKDAGSTTESKAFRLFHQDRYAPDEAAYLLGIPVETIYQAAFARQLEAEMVEHDVVSVSRDALLAWLKRDDNET
jgi:excisionase family DNA binding protein